MKNLKWEDVEAFLKEDLKKCSYIQTYGTIGSVNIQHDIDLIITKKPEATIEDFFKEIHEHFDRLNDHLVSTFGKKVVKFSRLSHQEEVLHIGNYEEGDIALHVMNHISLPQLKDYWDSCLERTQRIEDILKKEYKLFLGKIDMIFSEQFSKPGRYDYLFTYMNELDRINSNYPSEIYLKSMNKLFEYAQKRIGDTSIRLAKNKEEVRDCFYDLARKLDNLIKIKEN
ncbi:MAG: hypothetical protein PHE43_03100 [Candidatus Nanoarchaeia archaeon]|nr:hypothetical protein [Candidatus Nanoarchaeia archaeon]